MKCVSFPINTELLLQTYLYYQKKNELYTIDISHVENDYIQDIVKYIVRDIMQINVSQVSCILREDYTMPISAETCSRSCIYTMDDANYNTIIAKVTDDQITHKEFDEIRDVFFTPMKANTVYSMERGLYSVTRPSLTTAIPNENAFVFEIIHDEMRHPLYQSHVANNYISEPVINALDISYEKCQICTPYLVNELYYQKLLPKEVTQKDLNSFFQFSIPETQLQHERIDINLGTPVSISNPFSHIGFVSRFYSVTDCEWMVKNTCVKQLGINDFHAGQSHLLFAFETILERIKRFYQFPESYRIRNMHMDLISNIQSIEKQSIDLMYVLIQLSDKSISLVFNESITYDISRGDLLFFSRQHEFTCMEKDHLFVLFRIQS